MILISPSYEILCDNKDSYKEYVYKQIADAARTCYKSEGSSRPDADIRLIKRLVASGHEAMLEHASITVKFITDRGISHEIVRHRMASFAQESQRYCRYSDSKFGNAITYCKIKDALEIDPVTIKLTAEQKTFLLNEWLEACKDAEKHYLRILDIGASPQIARSVLNNSTKTEIVVTANIREWRHILSLRAAGTTGKPHPQMIELMAPLLKEFSEWMPELFQDIEKE